MPAITLLRLLAPAASRQGQPATPHSVADPALNTNSPHAKPRKIWPPARPLTQSVVLSGISLRPPVLHRTRRGNSVCAVVSDRVARRNTELFNMLFGGCIEGGGAANCEISASSRSSSVPTPRAAICSAGTREAPGVSGSGSFLRRALFGVEISGKPGSVGGLEALSCSTWVHTDPSIGAKGRTREEGGRILGGRAFSIHFLAKEHGNGVKRTMGARLFPPRPRTVLLTVPLRTSRSSCGRRPAPPSATARRWRTQPCSRAGPAP